MNRLEQLINEARQFLEDSKAALNKVRGVSDKDLEKKLSAHTIPKSLTWDEKKLWRKATVDRLRRNAGKLDQAIQDWSAPSTPKFRKAFKDLKAHYKAITKLSDDIEWAIDKAKE